jgi:hypothetical protein
MINTRNIRLAVCLAILFTFLARPSPVSACSCVADVTLPDNFALHDAVFAGKVIRIVDNYAPIFSSLDYMMFKMGYHNYFFDHFVHNAERRLGFSIFFKVINSWKGVEKTLAKVHTGRGDGDCGYPFAVGEKYLVYANPAYGIPGNYWVAGICSRTAELTSANEDLNYLTSIPTKPLQFAIPIPWAEQDLIFLLLSLIVLGLIIFIRRRLLTRKQIKTLNGRP